MNQKSIMQSINTTEIERQKKRKNSFTQLQQNKRKETSPLSINFVKQEYIELSTDQIGPRMLCKSCGKIFYYFQLPDHFQQCLKKESNAHMFKKEEDKVEIMKAEELPRSDQKEKNDDTNEVYELKEERIEEDKQKQQQQMQKKQIDFNTSLIELEKFEEKKKNISRIAFKKHESPEKKELNNQQFQEVPCPFCAKILQLTQLDHIDQCPKGKQCSYCHDKYPISLYYFHLTECKKKQQIRKPFKIGFFPSEKESQRKTVKQRAQKYQRDRNARQIQRKQYFGWKQHLPQRINYRELQEKSRIRQKNLTGLPQKDRNKLESQYFIPQENEQNKDCPICSFDFQFGDKVNKLPCQHVFHSDCLQPWLKQRSTCPSCKARISL